MRFGLRYMTPRSLVLGAFIVTLCDYASAIVEFWRPSEPN